MNRSRLRRQIAWCNRLANKDKGSYYTNLITANSRDPKKLWQSLRKVLHRTSETVLPAHSSDKSLADMFASFFSNKISKIRDTFSTSGSFNDAPDSLPPAFNAFMPVTEDEVYKCISESPTKSCSLDPIPTFLLKDCLDILLSSITKLVNHSLIEGSFPNSFKKAVVTPLIKKASLPRDNLKNYRPVSGLCFLSKLVERVVARQLTSHINNNKLDNPHQSAYKPGHSTETALLSIKNKVHLSLAHGEPTALVLLDLSAAFDIIDHNILLGYLKSWFGLGGTVLRWFASYLRNRCQAIKIGSTLSELNNLIYGVPQGSVLGPLLFSLYTTPLSKIIRLHPHIKFHLYADDTQLYIHLSHKNASSALAKLNACLHDVQEWMSLSKLKLNPEKTEFIVFGSKAQRQKTIVTLCSEVCPVSISTNCKVFRTPWLVLLQIMESMLMLHPFYRNSTGCLSGTVAFSKLQHLCINFCIVVLLLISNRSCLLVVVPIVLDIVTQIVNTLQFLLSIHQSSSQPNISAIVLPLMLLRSEMTSLKMFAVQHQLPPSERSLKHTCLQKPTHHSLPRHICVSLVRPGYVP